MSKARSNKNVLLIVMIIVTIIALEVAAVSMLHAANTSKLLENANARLSEQQRDLEAANINVANYQSRMNVANSLADEANSMVDPLKTANADLTLQNQALATQVTTIQEDLTAAQTQVDSLTAANADQSSQISTLTTRLAVSDAALTSANQSVSNLSREKAEQDAVIAELTRNLDMTKASLTAAQESIATLTSENADLNTRLNTAMSILMESEALINTYQTLTAPAN